MMCCSSRSTIVKSWIFPSTTRRASCLIGKTRLACETAHALPAPFPGGCFFVELKELTTVDQIAAAVADSLGLRLAQAGKAAVVLARMLKGREPTLIILDNFEHVAGLADRTVEV